MARHQLWAAVAVVAATVSSEALLLKAGPKKDRVTVWIHAFARSGSSTILSMISENEGRLDEVTNKTISNAFTLFEPCNPQDELEPQLATTGCVGVLRSLAKCDFNQIKKLRGWYDIHTKRRGQDEYVPELVNNACSTADVVAFKTISKAFENFKIQDDGLSLIEQEQQLHMVDVIRDPRNIYSSWMTTWPFNDTHLTGIGRDVTALLDICDTFAANLEVTHQRIHRIKFEDLVRNPRNVTKDAYDAIGLQFGSVQEKWIKKTFNAKDCPGIDQWIAPYSDCHTHSDQSLERWRETMTAEEKRKFANHPECQRVVRAYGYPID